MDRKEGGALLGVDPGGPPAPDHLRSHRGFNTLPIWDHRCATGGPVHHSMCSARLLGLLMGSDDNPQMELTNPVDATNRPCN